MDKIDNLHALNLYRPRRIYEGQEFPSIMAYIYYHILGKDKLHYRRMYEFYQDNPDNYEDLEQVFDGLETACRTNIIKNALDKGYKARILAHHNQIEEIKNAAVHTTRFDIELIHDIIKKICVRYQTKLTAKQKNALFTNYKIHETLNHMLSQGYDIKLFSNKDHKEILETLTQSHTDPLWEYKKNMFLLFYNNFPLKKVQDCALVEEEIKNPGTMVTKLRRNYILKSSLGMPEKKTLNDYIKQRIEDEKIKEMTRIYLNDKYSEYKFKNQDLLDQEWEEYINIKYLEILEDLTREEKQNLLDEYETVNHSEHHLKFIQELQNQLISDEEEQSLRENSYIPMEEEEPINEIFESKTQKELMKELEMGVESNDEEELPINNLDFLDPDHQEFIIVDSLLYPSISAYVYTKLLQWIEKNKLVYPLIMNTRPKKKMLLQDFKSTDRLIELCKQKYNERKVFYGLKILHVLLDNMLFCDQLLALDTGKIYIIMNDTVLGVDKQGHGGK